ncbi:MAG: NPCBM/NEW2 domain-containing protein [Candidatus Hydrogenedentes bacterium]|nr:NPCBM/NEW2 domain-containing protein [Candidatus Hydrogenedentota bacterium]
MNLMASVWVMVLFLALPGEIPQQLAVSGRGIARILGVRAQRLHTVEFRNEVAGRKLRTAGPEFVLTWGKGDTATSDDFHVRELKAFGTGVRAVLESRELGLRAELSYYPAADGPWIYKEVKLTNLGDQPFLLRTIEVEHLAVTDESIKFAVNPGFPLLGDWGQPVFTESLWFGLEFPAARSSATPDGVIFLRHYPGTEIAPGQSYTTKQAVIGAVRAGEIADGFQAYVGTLPQWNDVPKARIYWNGFRVIKPPNRLSQGLNMLEYARRLKEDTGFVFDGWTYDAGFDMYRPDNLFVPNEPEIWDRTAEALKPLGIPLGIWWSFSCIFDTPTHAWGITQGYELQHDHAYCLAGPKYFAAIKSRLEEVVSKYGVGAINFDGMYWGQGFGCNTEGHGHLIGEGSEAGVYATDRVVENKLKIFEALRRINPNIVLDLFVCNEWASPWWLTQLDGVHTVAGDTLGCDIPSPWLRDELITVRDIQVFDEHRNLRRQFPLWAEDLYGTQVRRDHLIDGITVTGEDMTARWEDEYVMALAGRGAISNHIICCDLETLANSRSGLEFLGKVGNWVRTNVLLYRDFRLLGGSPSLRQPYGYCHGDSQGRCLVALRNPWIDPRVFRLRLNEELGLEPSSENYFVNVVYPYRKTFPAAVYGETVDVSLQDYEVMLLEVRAASRQFPAVPADKRWDVDSSGNLLVFDEPEGEEVPIGRLTARTAPGEIFIAGLVTVPSDVAEAEVQLMLKPSGSTPPEPKILCNGSSPAVEFHRRDRQKGGDAWALIPLRPGKNTLRITVPGKGNLQVGAWCVATRKLAPTTTVVAAKLNETLFPVHAPNETREICTLLAPGNYSIALGPVPKRRILYLSELANRCVEANTGFGTVGWNASGWTDDPGLRIGREEYRNGMGIHAPATLVFDIAGEFAHFRAKVGLHGIPAEKKADRSKIGSCGFIVEGDGRTLLTTPVRKEGDPPYAVETDIRGVKILTLRTTDAGDSNWDDFATWAEARVERQ